MRKYSAFAALLCVCAISCSELADEKAVEVTEAPPIISKSWLNGTPPTVDEMDGKVVVIDVWAHG